MGFGSASRRSHVCSSARGALLFNEFHDRHLAGDLGLALALDVQAALREDLRIVVMSATLDGEGRAQLLDAARLSGAGGSFPVEVAHFPARRDESLEAQARRAVGHALATHEGDVLVFLPGRREIARLQAAVPPPNLPLPSQGEEQGVAILPLQGDLPIDQQSLVMHPDPQGRRRVILATTLSTSRHPLPALPVLSPSRLPPRPPLTPTR